MALDFSKLSRYELMVLIEGGVDQNGYPHDGLLRSLCWGKPDAWESVSALIAYNKNQQHEIMALRADIMKRDDEIKSLRSEIDYIKDLIDG